VDLPALGWAMEAHNLAPRGTWIVWKRDRATLIMVDTSSVWPVTVATIGKWFGLGRLPEPGPDAPAERWAAYCERDVLIIRTAVQAYLDWIESADLGNWQFTGAGMAFTTFRHKFMSHKLLVHADPDALAAEKRAMWTGRCEAYWHGTIGYQEVQEWDFETQYARIARDIEVPTQLVGPVSARFLQTRDVSAGHLAVLAEVTVTSDVPTVPTLHNGRIVWPVGTFRTTLWDVEIQAAVQDGATVTYHSGYLYRTTPALRDMAAWIIDGLKSPAEQCPEWRKAILKTWSRTWIGRFAMQYKTWDTWGAMPQLGAERRTVVDDIEDTTYDVMHVGHDLWREAGEVEWSQYMPAITGYIMAVARVRLWRVVQRMPPGSVMYVDTDSMIITDRFQDDIAAVTQIGIGDGLRLKSTYRGFSIMGPRQVVTGTRVRMAGVPILARQVGRHDFAGSVWESLDVAMRTGRVAAVRTSDRAWHVTGVDHRRGGRGVGWTYPIKVDIGEVKL
jgi:hypothetical protein